jgi:hypothetical protein
MNSHGLRYRWWVLQGEMSDPQAPRHHWVTSFVALFVLVPALNSIGLVRSAWCFKPWNVTK